MDETMTSREVAELFGVHNHTVTEWCLSKQIKFTGGGKGSPRYFAHDDVMAFKAARELKNAPPPPNLMTTVEVARLFGLPRQNVHYWAAVGKLKTLLSNGMLLFDRSEVIAFKAARDAYKRI